MTPIDQPTEPRKAVHAFLTCPEPGTYIINLSYGGPNLERTLISKEQLELLAQESVCVALRRTT